MTELAKVLDKAAHLTPGIYQGVPYDDYAAWPAVRASTLNKCVKSLAHGRDSEINPRADTKDLAFGTIFHSLILEPDTFDLRYAIKPSLDRRSPAGKESWRIFEAESAGKQVITESDIAIARAMRKGLMRCRDAASLLSGARAKELSLVWRDPETELLCKARIDMVSLLYGRTYIVDLKSAADASKLAFRRQSENLGYYRSLAYYRWGLGELIPAQRRCAIIAVEKSSPYEAAVYELTENVLTHGLEEIRFELRRYAAALESGNWPGYGDDIQDMDLSPYLQRQIGFE